MLNNNKQKMLGVGAVAALAMLAGGAVAAATPGTATITGGALAMTAPASVAFSATLTGTNQSAPATQIVNVVDSTGTGAGWNVTLTSTTFVTGALSLPDNSVTDTAASGACASGVTCTVATNSVAYPLTVPAATTAPTAVKILSAALNTGMGSQNWTHSMALGLLASVQAGTYTSTWTYSLVSAP
ncbi:MAG: hypothetical protein JWQ81_2640 [Amycolatopsis sp.]|jgi:hypothetical protein|uniref:hypothetical protein n=1 Tax=Amycolatopsis sp. TaxID=37632 RepID=UPI002601D98A|nr:hypothetical protein [Amycolatopsis sp.]MCU1681901.1 hypothetical protein [Amycolatopsis sp.]